jgi:hypothetical protein
MSANAKDWLHGLARPAPPVRAAEPRAEPESSAEPEAEKEDDVDASKAYGGLWSRRDRAHTAEFRFLDTAKPDESLDYNFLSRVQWRKDAGEIVLLYEGLGVKVVIRGLNLAELKERLRQHMVTWVQEQGNDPLVVRQAKEEARAEGRGLVLVEKIGFDVEEKTESLPGWLKIILSERGEASP